MRIVLLKNPDVDIHYVEMWLKEFDDASHEKIFLATFKKSLDLSL